MVLRLCLALFFIFGSSAAISGEKTYVFVHGSFVGEWYWQPIIDRLTADGHVGIAVSLTGHGKRAAENSPDIGLEDHVQDIVTEVTERDLRDIILVAHSYGGRPATGAWDRLRDRIAHLVYIEAVAPTGTGDIAIPAAKTALSYLVVSQPDIVDTGVLPVPEALRRFEGKALAPQSLRTVYGELKLQNGPLPDTPGTYVIGEASEATVFRKYAQRMVDDRNWTRVTVSGGHDVVSDATDDLVRLLLEIQP